MFFGSDNLNKRGFGRGFSWKVWLSLMLVGVTNLNVGQCYYIQYYSITQINYLNKNLCVTSFQLDLCQTQWSINLTPSTNDQWCAILVIFNTGVILHLLHILVQFGPLCRRGRGVSVNFISIAAQVDACKITFSPSSLKKEKALTKVLYRSCFSDFRKELFVNWLKTYSELTSIHGMRWHLCVKSLVLKIFFVALIVVMIIAMPTFFIYEAVDFFSQV